MWVIVTRNPCHKAFKVGWKYRSITLIFSSYNLHTIFCKNVLQSHCQLNNLFTPGTLMGSFQPPAFHPLSFCCRRSKGDLKCKSLLLPANSTIEWFKLALKNLVPRFVFELSTILRDRLMPSFCLHRVKKVYKVDYAAKDESNQRACFN